MNKMYFIAHVLPGELNKQVLKYKEKMADRFGCKVALKSPAHITLIPPFWMPEESEASLRSDLDEFAKELVPLTISAKGFGCFKPRTIFVEPVLTAELSKLKEAVDVFIRTHPEYPAKIDDRSFHPHITIATRDLTKKDFAEAWPLFETKPFEASWNADSISLLGHNKKNWDVVHTSQFKEFL